MSEKNFIENIRKKKAKAENLKAQWTSLYDEVYKYVLPFRGSAFNKDANKNLNTDYLFTSIGENSAITFVNRIQQLLTPINSDFIGLEINEYSTNNKEEIDEQLEIISSLLNNIKNGSNFDGAISEFYFDLVAGTACLLVQSGNTQDLIQFKTIPFNEYSITEGSNGKVDGVFRSFKLKKEELKSIWLDLKEEKLETLQEDYVELVEATIYNYDNKNYDYVVLHDKNILVKRVYKENPFIVLRWNKVAGEVYGRGVGIAALNDIKTLNKIMQYSLRTLAFQLPVFLSTSADVLDDDFLIEPGAINYVDSNETSNPTIRQLEVNGNNNIQQYNMDLLEMRIKKIMLDNTIPDNPNKQTATEILQRTNELNVNISSTFGRIIIDFLYPLVRRMLEVIQEFGHFREFDINSIDGYGFKIIIKTALARQNQQQELQDGINALSIMASFDPALINKYVKLDELMPHLLKLAGVDGKYLRNEEELEQYDMQQAQQQQAMTQQAMNNEIVLSNQIEKGKEDAKRGI